MLNIFSACHIWHICNICRALIFFQMIYVPHKSHKNRDYFQIFSAFMNKTLLKNFFNLYFFIVLEYLLPNFFFFFFLPNDSTITLCGTFDIIIWVHFNIKDLNWRACFCMWISLWFSLNPLISVGYECAYNVGRVTTLRFLFVVFNRLSIFFYDWG